MKAELFTFSGYENRELPAYLWLPDGDVRGILQLTHGMTEHAGRYTALAQCLTEAGIVVAGFDLRGHGQNPGNTKVASFGEGGWEASIEDIRSFFLELQARYPGIPHYMHGFSLGSFLLREYLAKYPEDAAGAVIIGTGNQPTWLLSAMQALVQTQIRKFGFDAYSPLVRKLTFDVYNQHFKPNKTPKDWLCSDEAQLAEFLADPLCRENFSAGLFYQMLGGMKRTGAAGIYGNWNKSMPVLLIGGACDPVGNMGKGLKSVYDAMKKEGMESIQFHLLPDVRHDVLHEEASGAAQTARDLILAWLKARE